MIKARINIRMDSGNLLKSDYFTYDDAIEELKTLQSAIEIDCARGSDFLFANANVICISKIESLSIETKVVDYD